MISACPQCGAFVPEDCIDYGRLRARCPSCRAEFPVAWDERGGLRDRRAPGPVDKPERFEVVEHGSSLEIRVPWSRLKYYFILPGASLTAGVPLYWLAHILDKGTLGLEVLMLVPAAWGLFLVYLSFVGLLDTAVLRIGHESLTVKHRPIPFRGARIRVREVGQIYSDQVVRRSRSGTNFVSYSVHALTLDGTRRKLLGDLCAPEEAWYLEQEIERFLGLDDRLVAGSGSLPRP